MEITNEKKRFILWASLLTLSLVVLFILGVTLGSTNISIMELLTEKQVILFHFRMPRVVMAIIVGAALALSAVIMQSITRNALVDTSIVGVNSAASLVVIVCLTVFANGSKSLNSNFTYIMPFFSIVGGIASLFIIYTLAWKKGVNNNRLILTGICLSTAYSALTLLLTMTLSDGDYNFATLWMSGTLWGSSWKGILSILPWALALIPYIVYKALYLDVFNLGEHTATSLGVNVERERFKLIFAAVLLSCSSIAMVGSIGFVGFVAAHIGRALVGPMHKKLIFISMLVGSVLLMAADLLVRVLSNGGELPVGMIISVLGAPYFLYLMIKNN